MANGGEVYVGEYLPCDSHSPLEESKIRLIPPKDSFDMWLSAEGIDGVIGFLADGNLLLPLSAQNKCAQVKMRLNRLGTSATVD